MPEWRRSTWSKGLEFRNGGEGSFEFSIALGEEGNAFNYGGKSFRWNKRAQAEADILGLARLFRQTADEIEAALASAPKEV